MVYEIVKTAYKDKNINSVIIGSPKSFVADRLRKEKIPFQFFCQKTSTAFENKLQSDNDLIVHFHNSDDLYKFRKIKGRCVVWGILAPQITEWNRFGIEKKLTGRKKIGNLFTRNMLSCMIKKKSIVSMDGATSDALNTFMGSQHEWPIIPIPVDASDVRAAKRRTTSPSGCLRISYIGRSADRWKLEPVRKLIQELSKIGNKTFKVNIYTDCSEPYLRMLKGFYPDNVSLEFFFGLYGPTIRSHLSENSDLHFAMGTAALEGGLAGVPTILIDPCEHEFPEAYRYRWLFQTERNSLGRFLNENETVFTGMPMNEVIETCFCEGRRIEAAEMCASYVVRNHSAPSITEKLLSLPAQATMEDICRFTPATWRIVTAAKALFAGI